MTYLWLVLALALQASLVNGKLVVHRNVKLTPSDVCAKPDHIDPCGIPRCNRQVSEATKRAVFKEYGIDYAKHECCEVDHLIPLELGGSNSIKNLWPEPWAEAHEKDKLENSLNQRVCKKETTLKDAQHAILGAH